MQRETSASTSDSTDIAPPQDGDDLTELEWPPPPDLWSHKASSLRRGSTTADASSPAVLSADGPSPPSITRGAEQSEGDLAADAARGRDRSQRRSTPDVWIALLGVTALIQGAYILKTHLMESTTGTQGAAAIGDVSGLRLIDAQPLVAAVAQHQADKAVAPAGAGNDSPSPGPLPAPTQESAGRLIVRSDPPGAEVLLDGRAEGVTPVSLAGIAPGLREVVVSFDGREIRQIVQVERGATASVIVPLTSTTTATGRVAFAAPWEVDILEDGVLVGTSRTPELMLPAGPHTLRFVNDTFGYEHTQRVVVEPGRTVSVPVHVPQGKLNVNALPWAEVIVDGDAIGETPLGDVSIDVGPHIVTFRHPELGEKTVSVAVKVGMPARVTVDMRK
jgi:PEGA domain